MSTGESDSRTAPTLSKGRDNSGTLIAELVTRSFDKRTENGSSYTLDCQTVTAIENVFEGQNAAMQVQIAELIGNAVRDGTC